MNIRRFYGILLRLYPRDYRAVFAGEMLRVFESAAEERRVQGWLAFARFVAMEWIGLVAGAGAEWAAKGAGAIHRRWAGEYCGVGQNALPDEVREAQQRIELDISRTLHAIANHDFPKARFYSDEERKERANLLLLREKYGLDE